ncbi:MAG: Hpt domain-containing protein [Spirochaetales bacterium]|nr:Hpt domain-containing protein [Spirochaetales bacterium]
MRFETMTDEQLKSEIGEIADGLPGLDTRSALNRLGGSPAMYIKFLTKFYDEYYERGAKLSELLARKDLFEAHRFVHSIKSLAGNLGADELYRSALSLEADMKRGMVMPSEVEVDNFSDELSLVLSELNAFLLARGCME